VIPLILLTLVAAPLCATTAPSRLTAPTCELKWHELKAG